MDCLPYIEDLRKEINILKALKKNSSSNNDEIEEKIKEKKKIIQTCEENLKNMSNNKICYKIYLYMLQGMKASEVIEKLAYENYINGIRPSSTTSLWRYYKKMQKILKKQKNGSEMIVN